MKRTLLPALCLGVLSVLGACSSGQTVTNQPLRSDVVEAYVATGLSEDVSNCIVGLGERQVELSALDPSSPTEPAIQALIDEIVLSCVDAERLGNPGFDQPPSLAFANEPDVFGDDRELDELWLWCEAGDGASCDQLWETAPIGSSYEKFGVTCGARYDVLDCSSELELPEGTTIDLSVFDPADEDSETEDGSDTEETSDIEIGVSGPVETGETGAD